MGTRSAKISIERLNQFTDRWATTIIVLSVLMILLITLIPFNFTPNLLPLKTILRQLLKPATSRYDVIANVALFVPLGFGIASYYRQQAGSQRQTAVVSILSGFGLSLAIEVLQIFLPSRYPSTVDILTNTTGAWMGFWLFTYWRIWILDHLVRLVELVKPQLSLHRLLFLLAVYTVLIVSGSTRLQHSSYLVNWDPNFPLVIGNERTGDRPWQGSVSELYMADRALSESEVAALMAGKSPTTMLHNSLLAAYQLKGQGNYHDQTGHLPDLVWQGTPPTLPTDAPAQLSPGHWLVTELPVTPLNQKIRESSQLTLITTIATNNIHQFGHSRAISVSADPRQRNFTLAQQNTDLVFRFRTPFSGINGASPALVFPNIFQDTNPHRLVLTYGGSVLKLYVDTVQQSHTRQWTPEVKLFKRLVSMNFASADLDLVTYTILKLVYYGLLFVPVGVLLGVASMTLKRRFAAQPLLVYGSVLLPAILLEVNRMMVSGTTVQPLNVLLSVAIAMGTLFLIKAQIAPWLTTMRIQGSHQSRA